ncbi:MAG TPA: LytTR family DNA-binding domain-containing protein [Rubricoccaceae bacterium]|jgi:two-component system LytT family response regulator
MCTRDPGGSADGGAATPTGPSATRPRGGGPVGRLFVRERGRIVPVRLAEIVRLEAQGDYALLHTGPGPPLLAHLSLGAFESRPDTGSFLRVHRSHMVNLDFVRAFVPHDVARLAVELTDGTTVVASRARSTFIRRHTC